MYDSQYARRLTAQSTPTVQYRYEYAIFGRQVENPTSALASRDVVVHKLACEGARATV